MRGLWLEGAEPAEAQAAIEELATQLGARDIELPGCEPRSRLVDEDFDALAAFVGDVEDDAAAAFADGFEQVVDVADARDIAEAARKAQAEADHADRDRHVGAHAPAAQVGHPHAEPARAV